ncbi:hypothetical protein G9A89_023843 [Geosiphon pyriformis]|nr:hypothetical protein G9A89_023843 [Geosiphon pyriformis]
MFKVAALVFTFLLPFLLLYFLRADLQEEQKIKSRSKINVTNNKKKKKKKGTNGGNKKLNEPSEPLKKEELKNDLSEETGYSNFIDSNSLGSERDHSDQEKQLRDWKENIPFTVVPSQTKKLQKNMKHRKELSADFPPLPSPTRLSQELYAITQNQSKETIPEIDPHMDPSYFNQHRVMRIVAQEKEPKKSAHSVSYASPRPSNESLSKTQKKNMVRAAKKKEEAKLKQEIQATRLQQHKRELENERIKQFYQQGSSKPTSSGWKFSNNGIASLDEAGHLVWD